MEWDGGGAPAPISQVAPIFQVGANGKANKVIALLYQQTPERGEQQVIHLNICACVCVCGVCGVCGVCVCTGTIVYVLLCMLNGV